MVLKLHFDSEWGTFFDALVCHTSRCPVVAMFKNCRLPVSRLYLRIIYRCINFLAGLSRCIILVLHQKFAYTFLGIQQTILRQIFYAFFGEFALRGDCTQ